MPISDCQVRDPRIRRTRKLLQSALGSLMHSKSFEEISVQDIAEAATVNRATFYDHYTDKYALLEAMAASGFHDFLDAREAIYQAGCASTLANIVLATCDFLTQAHAGGQCDRLTAFAPLMDAAITKAIQRLLLEGLQSGKGQSRSACPELVAAAASAAVCGAVKQWFSMPDRPPAGEIAPTVAELVLPMLLAASPAAAEDHRPPSSPALVK